MMYLSLALVAISLLSLSSYSLPPPPNLHTFTKIYAFGDSFTDTGNYNATTGGPDAFAYVGNPPYGSTFFHHPARRYSDGRLVVDFLASALSLPLLPPYHHQNATSSSHGVNFAVAFSSALDPQFYAEKNESSPFTLFTAPVSLSTQLKWFESYLEGKGCRRVGSEECGKELDGALFWVGEIGFDDYTFAFDNTMTVQFIQQQAVHGVVNFLQEILKKGGKHVIVQGLPAIGCLPLTLSKSPPEDRGTNGCFSTINNVVDVHNSLLQDKLYDLRSSFPTSIISYADFFNAHLTVIKNPKAHGFMEPFMACCGIGGAPYNYDYFDMCGSSHASSSSSSCSDPSEFVNWDGIHLTEAMNKEVADMFFHGSFCNPSFNLMLSQEKGAFGKDLLN